MTDNLLLSTPKKLTPKMSAAIPEKMATPKKIAPKKTATPNKKTTPEKMTHNKKSPKMYGLVPQMTGSNEEADYLRKETESKKSRDRHIRKLEDVKALKEDNKYLRRKIRKLEERNSLQEVNGEAKQQSSVQEVKQPSDGSSVCAQQEVTIDNIKKVQHWKSDQHVFKVLCLNIFTKDQLKNSSRTGKKKLLNVGTLQGHHLMCKNLPNWNCQFFSVLQWTRTNFIRHLKTCKIS